jgi:hypothetical protein
MIDANFKSTISLRNYLTADPITVTPILYLSNGREYPLAPVTLEPSGIASISIRAEKREGAGQALRSACAS